MPIKMRRLYLETIRLRYKNAPKREKSQILNEFCQVCGYSRKYAVRILNGEIQPRMYRPGPKPKYGPAVALHLKHLWELMQRMCSKKMAAALPLWLEFYKDIDPVARGQLLAMSASTIDRLLRPHKQIRGRSTTQASLIKSRIPIKLLDGDVDKPGFIEADTVAHCGESIDGQYIYSLTMTDLFSSWTENRACRGKTGGAIEKLVKNIEEKLPFELRGFACDNGTEFLNEDLHSYLHRRLRPVEFVRRRPYKKNDAAHVEQKNFTHVRELLGYRRLEHPELVPLINEIYQAYWNPLWNLFTPSMKLISKTRIGGRIQKKYDKPQTPCQRLLSSPQVPLHHKRNLRNQLAAKNPIFLSQELEKKLKILFDLADRLHRTKTGTHD